MHYTGRNVLDHHPNKGQLEVYWSMKDFNVPEPAGGAPKIVDYGTKVSAPSSGAGVLVLQLVGD